MLEVSSKEIAFQYSENSILTATLNIRNLLPHNYISYKVPHLHDPDKNDHSRLLLGEPQQGHPAIQHDKNHRI
jgi:hypothetical protein